MTYDAPAAYARLIAPRYAPVADALVETAELRADDDVLEVGAGTGLVTGRAAPAVRSIMATDLSPGMLSHARASSPAQENVTYLLLDYSHPLPFLDGSFSLLSGLTYLQNSSFAIAEVARVLRRDGRIALSMWGPSYHEKRLLNAALKSLSGGRFPDAAPARAVARLERAGFRSVRRSDLDLTNRFASIDEYLAYRRGFGIPTAWTQAFYERFLQAIRREAAKTFADDGSFTLGWTLSLITARSPRRAADAR